MEDQASHDLAREFLSLFLPCCASPHAQHFAVFSEVCFGFVVLLLMFMEAVLSPTADLVALPCSFCAIKDTVSSSDLSVFGSPSKSDRISGSAIPRTKLSLIISLLKSKVWSQFSTLHVAV